MRNYRSILAICAIGFILRIVSIWLVHPVYLSDEIEYIGIARQLTITGEFIDSNGELAKRSPFYSYFLSFFFHLFGDNLLIPQIFGCLLALGVVVLTYILSMQLWNNKKAALITAGAVSLYPGLIIYAGLLLTETLYIIFFLSILALANKLTDKPFYILAVLLGLISGLAALTRAVYFGFFPILLFVIWFVGKSYSLNTAKQIILALILFCFVLFPWTYRNYKLFNDFVPVSSWGGQSLIIGNNPYATGTWRVKDGYDKWYNEQAVKRGINLSELNEVEKSALSKSIAIEFMYNNPGKTIELAVKKAHMFLIYPITHTDSYIPIQLIAVVCDFVLLVGAVIGFVFVLNKNRKVWFILSAILFFFLLQVLLHAEARYRLPLAPLLCLFFGWGVNILLEKETRLKLIHSKYKIIIGILLGLIVVVYAYTGILFLQGAI